MSVADTSEIIRLPTPERPGYGDPYPDGFAVGVTSVTGDASGGSATLALQSQGGFLYRLEMLNIIVGDTVSVSSDLVTVHSWAADQSGLGSLAFQLNFVFDTNRNGNGFHEKELSPNDLAMVRRFPIGLARQSALTTVLQLNIQTNTNTITYQLEAAFAFWRNESLHRPGFLEAFWEAPPVVLVR